MSVLMLLPLLVAAEPVATQRLTIDDTVELAIRSSSALAAARARARGNDDQAKSVRGRLLPSINLSDEWQHWDSPFDVSLDFGPNVPFSAPPLRAREQTTNAFVAALDQPLLGLLHLTSDEKSLDSAAQAAAMDARTLEANLRAAVRAQFLRMFEARALAGIARASQEQLREQQAVAKERLAAGVLTPADVLRLDVAAANARQQEIQAEAAEQTARTSLLVALGRPAQDTSIDFVEPATPDKADERDGELVDLVSKALGQRTELRSASLRVEAADSESRSRGYRLLPELDLEAGYMHMTGQTFVKVDSAFVGLKAGWQIWDWGADFYQHRAAKAQAHAAHLQLDDARRQVETDVAARLADVRATASALETGRTAIGSAEEAYRVTTVLLAAGSANTTDLLDAQAALTQARLNFARARYAYALARMSLDRALGN